MLVFNDQKLIINDAKPIEHFDGTTPSIILFHLHRQPHHLGFIIDQIYFSINMKGYDERNYEAIRTLIIQKAISVMIVQFKAIEIDPERVRKIFNKHSLENEYITCLNPIIELMETSLHQKINADVVFDFLKFAVDNHIVHSCFINPFAEKTELSIYDRKSVLSYIKYLRKK